MARPSRVSAAQRAEIRRRYHDGESLKALAAEFELSESWVCTIGRAGYDRARRCGGRSFADGDRLSSRDARRAPRRRPVHQVIPTWPVWPKGSIALALVYGEHRRP